MTVREFGKRSQILSLELRPGSNRAELKNEPGPKLPVSDYESCIVKLNKSMIMVMGEGKWTDDEYISAATYLVTFPDNPIGTKNLDYKSGPSMIHPRKKFLRVVETLRVDSI